MTTLPPMSKNLHFSENFTILIIVNFFSACNSLKNVIVKSYHSELFLEIVTPPTLSAICSDQHFYFTLS